MAGDNATCDVVITHAPGDAALAKETARACHEGGIEAITENDLLAEEDASDALWEALAESMALLVILSPTGPTASMFIEIGAARAWNKPIYAIVTDTSLVRASPALTGISLYPVDRLNDVIRAIQSILRELTDEDHSTLIRIYAEAETSTDQLAIDTRKLQTLTRRFERETGKAVTGERLLSEILRLRKNGKLPRKRGRPRPKSEPAGGRGPGTRQT